MGVVGVQMREQDSVHLLEELALDPRAIRRSGPTRRCSTGSVSRRVPSSSISAVEWPAQVTARPARSRES